MKTLYLILLTLCIGCRSYSQTDISNAPQWSVILKVVDESATPISNATVRAGYYIPPPPGQSEAGAQVTALTDTNGLATLTARSGPSISCSADCLGYYSSVANSWYFFDSLSGTNGKWKPWNPALTFTLKKIENPIAMYAKSVNLGMPVFDKAVGYDLLLGDWVAPFGKGASSDIVFTAHNNQRSRQDYEYKLAVNFTNPQDGIQLFTSTSDDRQSGLLSPHEAPSSGYQSEWIAETINHPNQPFKDGHDSKRNYFIRVRTVLDTNGSIKSALYGKIYGDFMQFTYYVNPAPNDRNIEFDPQKNLIKNIDSSEAAKLP